MNAEEMRIAIAERLGWVHQPGEAPVYGGRYKATGWWSPDKQFSSGGHWKNGKQSIGLPNYPADLNAMHEAEKALAGPRDDPESEVSRWKEQLMLVCGDKKDPWNCYDVDLFMATALQRAEAFCRVFWPERFKE